jgi:hypothetical protein
MTRPTVLAYYFPSWHRDPRNAEWFGAGWTEWELVKGATARFPGHRQPRVMWANHHLVDIFPSRSADGAIPQQLKDGALDRTAFESMARFMIERYFSRPNYLRLDGRPWFTLYDIANFVAGLGGVEAARDALDWFRAETERAGHPGLHLDAVLWSAAVIPTGSDSPLSAHETFDPVSAVDLSVDAGVGPESGGVHGRARARAGLPRPASHEASGRHRQRVERVDRGVVPAARHHARERFPGSDPHHVRNSVAASVADQPTDAPTMRAGLRDRDAG